MPLPPAPDLAGLRQVPDANGQLLPVIDLSQPAFAITLSDQELAAKADAYRREEERRARIPRWLLRPLLNFLLRRSELARRLRGGNGTFLDGMSTYRLKLGPAGLDPAWAAPIDRVIAASPPCLFLRLRLQDMAELLADDLAPRLAAAPGKPLHLFNIAGGPSMDSLNALILLRQRDAALLRERRVQIHLFDQDDAGPGFAARALAALRESAGPLAGVDVTLTHLHYRWDDTAVLRDELARLPAECVASASSEGGLFNYGSDDDILANLDALRSRLPAGAKVVGSLTPPNAPGSNSVLRPRFAVRERELKAFTALVERAQWSVQHSRERAFHTVFRLTH
jgi:hypothetical protein